jgi:hypothetical protein
MMNPISRRTLRTVLAAGTVLATASTLACSSSSTTTTDSGASSAASSGKTSSSKSTTSSSVATSATSGSSSVTSSTVASSGATSSTVASSGSSAATSCGDAGGLYDRLGGHDGIRAVVAAELMNADIASYFFFQTGVDGGVSVAPANGHPTANQIEECFADLVGNAAAGPEKYPTTVGLDGGVLADGGTGYACRTITNAHRALQINSGTFDEFITIAAGVLSPKLCAGDLAVLGGALTGFAPDIVTAGDGGVQAFPGDAAGVSKLDATF